MSDPRAALEAALAGRYALLSELGVGGTATVYLADDLKHDRRVAIKVLRPGLAAMLGPDRFLEEIRVTAGLNHPHITPLYDSGESGGFLYYVMPAVEDQSLRERLTHERQLGLDDALAITRALADALDYAHEHNVVHRDIKPENILMHRGNPQLADFGIAGAIERAGGDRLTATGMSIGTPAYMSPEQASGDRAIGPRSDLYSLAAVVYEMLAGEPPFTGGTVQALVAKVLVEPAPQLSRARVGVPRHIEAAVARALLKVPGDRFASAGEFAAALAADAGTLDAETTLVEAPMPLATGWRSARWRRLLAGAALVGIAAVAAWFAISAPEDPKAWVRDHAIPEIERFVAAGDWENAWALAKEADARVPGDPEVAKLSASVSIAVPITSEPEGARVFRKAYSAGDDAWTLLGITPLAPARFPRDGSLLRVELDGFRTVLALHDGGLAAMHFTLDKPDPPTEGMVRVTGWTQDIGGTPTPLSDFFIGKYEVTNAEFTRFVDAGGYREKRYWQHPFVFEGRTVSWSDAMARFTDETGRTGPGTWLAGTFPDGQEDFPVGGVSWYEAAAYAQFVGKALPTAHHWTRAHSAGGFNFAAYVLPASNLGAATKTSGAGTAGPATVGQYSGIGPFGTFDMAGNVREWVFNETAGDRALRGGGWDDGEHMALVSWSARPAFDRTHTNGIRLASYLEDDAGLTLARTPLPSSASTGAVAARPVSDDVLEVYQRMFDYDRTPLDARIEQVETTRHWIRQKISLNTAYAGERMTLYLYLPLAAAQAQPPLQTVLYWPGSGAMSLTSFEQWSTLHIDFIVQSGRAIAFPVLAGTFERREEGAEAPFTSNAWRDRAVKQVKEVRRSLDYLETRSEIDATRLAYYGYSWGSAIAPVVLANEPRLKAAVLYVPGFWQAWPQPEVSPLTYLHRVQVPVVQLSGRLDTAFPLETHSRPFFEMLGTPAASKRHVVAEGGHFVPRPVLIREALDWLDRYLGVIGGR